MRLTPQEQAVLRAAVDASSPPTIDTGTSLGADVPTDIDGTSRPQRLAYDIGCYEMP